MNKNEIISKIDEALLNVNMPPETRELLISLKCDIPKAKTKEELFNIAIKWGELITKVVILVMFK